MPVLIFRKVTAHVHDKLHINQWAHNICFVGLNG